MRLLISNKRSVKEISTDFTRCFPFLRIEFFNMVPIHGETSLLKKELPGPKQKINLPEQPVIVEFKPSASVAGFEKQVTEKTGLFARVFRRQNHRWIEIKHAKDSLDRFNIMGMASESDNYNYHTLFL